MAELFKTAIISDEILYLKPSSNVIDLNAPPDSTPLGTLETIAYPDSTPLETLETITHAETITDLTLMDDLTLIKEHSFNQGFSEGLVQATAQIAEQKKTLNNLLQSIPAAISEHRLQLSTEIADIVLSIAQQFFIHQQQNKESIAQQITQTITQLNNKQNIELSLHPHDLALLQKGQIKINLKQCKNLRVIADDDLRLGGCVVRSEHGVFDAGIERQIDRLKHALLEIKNGETIES
jgi:flagellar assembly protein FliH